MKSRELVLQEIEESIATSVINSDPQWQREFLISIYAAAVENEAVQIDDVWAVFERRGSGLETHNNMAAGGLMRRAAKLGFIRRAKRPQGVYSARNHNLEGTAYWRSQIHRPGEKVPDWWQAHHPHPPEQAMLFAE